MNDRFFIYAGAFAVVILVTLYLLDDYVTSITVPSVLYGFVVVFSALTYVLHAWLVRANDKSPKLFITYFMGSISIKLFLTLIFLFIYIFFYPAEKIVVGITAVVVYFAFTGLQIGSLYKKLNP